MGGKPLTRENAEVGTNLRRVRKRAKRSQEDMGTLIGLSGQQISKIERGINRLSADRVQPICAHLGIPVSEILPSQAFEGSDGLAENAAPYDASGSHDDVAKTLVRFVRDLGEPSRTQAIALVTQLHEGLKNLESK